LNFVSKDKILWWITCPKCKTIIYAIDGKNEWLNLDPSCTNPSCELHNDMIMGLENPFFYMT